MRKPAAKSTPRRAAAARTNGAKGGRPKERIPEEVLQELGEFPFGKPFEIARWWQHLLGRVALLRARGEIGVELTTTMLALAKGGQSVFPLDLTIAVEEMLRAEREAASADHGGPETEELGDARPAAAVRKSTH